eukprot:1683659-Rhodomonas_salina.1
MAELDVVAHVRGCGLAAACVLEVLRGGEERDDERARRVRAAVHEEVALVRLAVFLCGFCIVRGVSGQPVMKRLHLSVLRWSCVGFASCGLSAGVCVWGGGVARADLDFGVRACEAAVLAALDVACGALVLG